LGGEGIELRRRLAVLAAALILSTWALLAKVLTVLGRRLALHTTHSRPSGRLRIELLLLLLLRADDHIRLLIRSLHSRRLIVHFLRRRWTRLTVRPTHRTAATAMRRRRLLLALANLHEETE
jgi:hypothetical protein